MSIINNNNWKKIDDENEELILNNVKYIKPINDELINIFCEICNNVISQQNDVESMRNNNCCSECFLTYYYTNKEKWQKGWRPNKVEKN